jgi:hypothetical protein
MPPATYGYTKILLGTAMWHRGTGALACVWQLLKRGSGQLRDIYTDSSGNSAASSSRSHSNGDYLYIRGKRL